VVLGWLSVSSGCAKSAPPPGKVVAVENACSEADELPVRVTGYVRYKRGLMSFCSSYGGKKTCDLALYAGPEKPPDFNIMRPQTGPDPVHRGRSGRDGRAAREVHRIGRRPLPE
jgi:hypothetical protein